MNKIKLAQTIVRRRYILFALVLIAAALSVFGISKTRINYDLTRYLSDDTMTKRALAVMEAEFGSTEQLRVMFEDMDEEQVNACADRINALPGVLFAAYNAENGTSTDAGCTYRLVTVTLSDGDASETVRQIRDLLPDAGPYYVGGSAANQLDLQKSIGKEIPEVMVIAVAVILIMLLVTSHAWLEPAIILLVLAVSVLINMGTHFVFPDVSFITFAVSAILQLALSIDYAIMLLNTYDVCRDKGLAAAEAMTEALAACFMRIASSALTTVAGLLSLLFMSFTIGFDIGLALSKGILCSMLCVFLFMPALTVMCEKPLLKTRHKPLRLGGEHLARFIAKAYQPLAAVMTVIVLGGLYLNYRNTYSFNASVSNGKSDSALISAHFGTSNPLVILIPGGETDADYDRQRQLADSLLALQDKQGEPLISSVTAMVTTGEAALKYYTVTDVAAMTGQSALAVRLFFITHGITDPVRGDKLLSAAASLAAGNEQIRQMQDLYQSARSAFVGKTYSRMLAEVSFSSNDPDMYSNIDQIISASKEIYGDDLYITGTSMSSYDIAHAFRSDLVRVNIITLLAILFIVTVSFRSFTLPLLLVFVIEGAIFITMGLTGLIYGSVYFISYLICLSIQMGATIDYGILLSDQYRSLREKGLPSGQALKEAMSNSLPTVMTSGAILTVAGYIIGKKCSIFYISDIGLLVSRGALISAVLVLTLLPALLMVFDRAVVRKKQPRSGSQVYKKAQS